MPWSDFISALQADATTSNDSSANSSLPGTALSPNILPSSAGGRAVGLNTPAAMSANGSVGSGPYDGIVTLNSGQSFRFTRPATAGEFDALRSTEHEMDEILGLGSYLNGSGSDVRPQDLFSWSGAGNRNISSSGVRYFSINSGSTNIVNLNQDSNGDFGDWLSASCPQANPYVQDAFSCSGQSSDVTTTSPEGINLDVIGYNLVTPTPTPTPTTFTISITAAPVVGGTVLGGGSYSEGSNVTVVGIPRRGFAFSSWTEAGIVVSTSASYTFSATSDRSLVASFARRRHTRFPRHRRRRIQFSLALRQLRVEEWVAAPIAKNPASPS